MGCGASGKTSVLFYWLYNFNIEKPSFINSEADPKETEKGVSENGQPKKDLFPGGKAFEVEADANFDDDSDDPLDAAGAGGKVNYGKAPVKGQEKQLIEGDGEKEECGDLDDVQTKMEGKEGAEEVFEPTAEKGAEKEQSMKKVPPEALIMKEPVKNKLQKMDSKKAEKKQKSSKSKRGDKKSKSKSKKKNAKASSSKAVKPKKSPSKKSSKSSKKKKSNSKSNKPKKSASAKAKASSTAKKSSAGKKKKSSSTKPAAGKTNKP